MNKLKPYDEYKDSGIEWLGEIPAHWELRRMKELASFLSGGTPSTDNDAYWNGEIPWVSPKDMKSDRIIATKYFVTPKALKDNRTTLVPKQSILIVVRSGILRHSFPAAINAVDVTINQDIKAIIPNQKLVSPHFLRLLLQGLQHELLTQWRKEGTTVESIEMEYLLNGSLPIPPLPEQTQIAAYLSRQTALIDQKISLLQQKIDKYQELKKSLINEAVCRGLEKDVLMKDSGVEWIGEVPAHWEVRRVKDLSSLVIYKSENTLRKIGLENIESGTGKYIDTTTHFEGDGVEFRKDDLLFGKLRPYLAKVYLGPGEE